jgi:hypothetical protein
MALSRSAIESSLLKESLVLLTVAVTYTVAMRLKLKHYTKGAESTWSVTARGEVSGRGHKNPSGNINKIGY